MSDAARSKLWLTACPPDRRGRTPSRSRHCGRALVALVLLCLACFAHAGKPFRYYAVGEPERPVYVVPPASPAYVLMGGGLEVDEAFRWMIRRAGITPSTGGRFVVIRATGDDAYNQYLFSGDCPYATCVDGAALGLSAVETLVIPSRAAANDDEVIARVARANVLWIAGGDQAHYIDFWKGTRLEAALKGLLRRNVPFGGLSAGMAVLGQFDFTAQRGSVVSGQALGDPYNKYMTFDPDPLALAGGFLAPPELGALAGTILDTHVDTRDRLGRLVAFVARLVAPYTRGRDPQRHGCPGGVLRVGEARGIGGSIQTALLVEYDAAGRLRGTVLANPKDPGAPQEQRAIYLLSMSEGASVCAPGTPLSIGPDKVELRKLEHGSEVDLGDWSSIPLHDLLGVDQGVLTEDAY